MVFSGVISFERSFEKKGAPSCGVYLIAPKKWPLKQAVIQLGRTFAALNASKYERNMHAVEFTFPDKIYEKERMEASELVNLCKVRGIVPIIRDDLGLCVECNAEGLMLSAPEKIAEARKVLGESAIIGLDCGNSREMAEVALKEGVDYVSFGKFFSSAKKSAAPLDILHWWGTKTELPAVAVGNLTEELIVELARSGAGFIGGGNYVWNHKKGPAQAIYMLQECIEFANTHNAKSN